MLQLALIAAQLPESAALLAAQESWGFLQSVSRWLMAPEGGALAHPPEVVGGLGYDKQLTSVDFAGAYGVDGEQSPVHQLWCLTLSVQGARPTPYFSRERIECEFFGVRFHRICGQKLVYLHPTPYMLHPTICIIK